MTLWLILEKLLFGQRIKHNNKMLREQETSCISNFFLTKNEVDILLATVE